jgi:hypothetical protein
MLKPKRREIQIMRRDTRLSQEGLTKKSIAASSTSLIFLTILHDVL